MARPSKRNRHLMEIRQKAIENRKKAIEAKKRQRVGEDGVPLNELGQDNVLVRPGGGSALIHPEGDSVLDSVLIRPEMDDDPIHPQQEISSDDSSSSDSDSDEDSDDDMPTDALNTSQSTAESRMGLCWNDEAGNHIRGPRGTSKSTEKRARRHQRELEKAASQSHSIVHLFQRQQNLGLSMEAHLEIAQEDKEKPREDEEKARQEALDDLKRLLHHEEEQRNKYGKPFATGKNFQRRHLMVESFLALQQQKQELPDPSRRGLATLVARNYGKGGHTVRKIVQWEKSWVKDRTIPESKSGTHRHNSSWMDDKALLSAVQEFIKSQGEGITSPKLAQFVNDYITQNRANLQKNLGSVGRIGRTILSDDAPARISSRTARRWLNRLGYNMRDGKRDAFPSGHERNGDVVE